VRFVARRCSSAGFFVAARSAVPLFLDLFSPVFLSVLSCFVSIAFFIAIARSYIVFLWIFAPVNRLYLFLQARLLFLRAAFLSPAQVQARRNLT
jgi:hypothetical protein